MNVPILANLAAKGQSIDVLFWVGCAGSFDPRAQKVTRAFANILNHAGVRFAVLGSEESCTGDPARRAGNEFVFQMTALQNIQTLDGYGVRTIVTACPHCFNTLKHEYPALGGTYEVFHHTQFIQHLIETGRLQVEGGRFQGHTFTYHDSCYLGRVNGVYEVPRALLHTLDADLVEMKRSKSQGLCCGAGGAQMFKEDEPGDKRINAERVDEIEGAGADAVAVNCPFCLTMLKDGITAQNADDRLRIYDIAELISESLAAEHPGSEKQTDNTKR